jgi:hypothetical protein
LLLTALKAVTLQRGFQQFHIAGLEKSDTISGFRLFQNPPPNFTNTSSTSNLSSAIAINRSTIGSF